MSQSSFTTQKLKILESVSPVDTRDECLKILELFISLDKADRKEFSETFYAWAGKNASYKPLLFCYAKLIFGFNLFYSEDYLQAFPILTEAQQAFTEQDEPDGVAICNIILGGIHRTFGNIDMALQSSMAGRAQLMKSGTSMHYLLAANINIASIYSERKHFDEAIPLFKSTYEMAEPSLKYYWMVYALHGLGKVYLHQNKSEDAKQCFEKAMVASERFGNQLSICNSMSELGNYYYACGDFAAASGYHEKSLRLRLENKFTGGAITSCIRLSEIYQKTNETGKAIEVLEKGLKLAEEINIKMKMYQIHFQFSEIFEKQGDLARSLHHYKKFVGLREQVEQEDNDKKIKNAQVVFESEQTKKENVIIKKQKEEIERKNIELQETIDKLTRARIGKKARAITLIIAIGLFMMEDLILHFALTIVNSENYFISIAVKMIIIFSLSPINKAIEEFLLRKMIRQKREVLV